MEKITGPESLSDYLTWLASSDDRIVKELVDFTHSYLVNTGYRNCKPDDSDYMAQRDVLIEKAFSEYSQKRIREINEHDIEAHSTEAHESAEAA